MDELLSQAEINALLSGGPIVAPLSSDLSMEDSQIMDEVASIFSNAESKVFGMLAGKDVNTQVTETVTETQQAIKARFSDSPFVFRTTFGGFDDIPLLFVVDRRGALTLADLMMGGEGQELPEEVSELYLNAAQEGLSQVVGSAFTSMSGLLGGRRLMPENTSSTLETGEWLPFPNLNDVSKIWASATEVLIEGLEAFSVWVSVPLDSAKSIALLIHQIMGEQAPQPTEVTPTPGTQQVTEGRAEKHHPSAPVSAPLSLSRGAQQTSPPVDVHPAEFTPLAPRAPVMGSSKIDLIADIPVRVTVELGKTRKNISEILAMTTGSVIELDKMAGELVDVLVNGKLVARGEVVVIDENFGVRISEVLNTTSKSYSL